MFEDRKLETKAMSLIRFLIMILNLNFFTGVIIAHPQLVYVTPVDSPTKEEKYLCVAEADPEHTKYSWQRQDGNLPEDVKAVKNQLHFLKSSSDLNGLYICIAENKFGKAMGSLFRYKIKETIFHHEL